MHIHVRAVRQRPQCAWQFQQPPVERLHELLDAAVHNSGTAIVVLTRWRRAAIQLKKDRSLGLGVLVDAGSAAHQVEGDERSHCVVAQ